MSPIRPTLRLTFAAAAVALLLAGCMGVRPGAADLGDSVTIQYTAYDLQSGDVLRDNRSATFSVGDGDSGLGLQLEKAMRGHASGDRFQVTVQDDSSLDYSGLVEVNRTLSPIEVHQSAPRADFEQYVGPPSVGQTFDAYGVYTGEVTALDNDTVTFRVLAQDGQSNAVPSVGATLVTHVTPDLLERRLDPVVGATFTIQPPSPYQPTTPLGLAAGSYKVIGATDRSLQYSHSSQGSSDLIGHDLRFDVEVLQVTAAEQAVPTGGNFGVRDSPQVNGDPHAALDGGALQG